MAISDEDIENLAKSPQRARTDEGSVQERSIKEIKEADAYLQQRVIGGAPWGIRIARTMPTDTLGRP